MTHEPYPDVPLIFLVRPTTRRLRALGPRAFTPRRMQDLEARIRKVSADYLDRHSLGSDLDYVQGFAAPPPSLVISARFGVPLPEQEQLRHHIDLMFHIETQVGTQNPTVYAAQGRSVVTSPSSWPNGARRRRTTCRRSLQPLSSSSMTARRVRYDPRGRAVRIHDHQRRYRGPARLLGWAAVILEANPGQRAELAADATLVPNAVEALPFGRHRRSRLG